MNSAYQVKVNRFRHDTLGKALIKPMELYAEGTAVFFCTVRCLEELHKNACLTVLLVELVQPFPQRRINSKVGNSPNLFLPPKCLDHYLGSVSVNNYVNNK